MKKGLFGATVFILMMCLMAEVHVKAKDKAVNAGDINYVIISEPVDDGCGEVSVVGTAVSRTKSFSLTIPDIIEVDGSFYKVTGIEKKAFYMSSVKKVKLPDTITVIGEGSFAGCKKLSKITIPASCTHIGDTAFYKCTALSEVLFEEREEEETSLTIGDAAFSYTLLSEIRLIEGISEVGQSAFYGCSELKDVIIGEDMTSIGAGAFAFCNQPVNISLTKKNEAFYVTNGCIYSADKKTLIMAPAAQGDISVRKGTETISEYAFEGNSGIKSVTIPKTVGTIEKGAFLQCTGMEAIELNNGVKRIEADAFNGCSSLKGISIPKTVTYIGTDVFKNCFSMKKLTVEGGNKKYCGEDNLLLTKSRRTLVSAPCAKGTVTVPDSVKHIGEWAFNGNTRIKKVMLPAGLKDIARGAFFGCEALSYVRVGSRKLKLCEETVYAPGDGENKYDCRIFGGTHDNIEINFPYGSDSEEKGSIEKQFEPHCPEGVIFTTR